MSRPISILFYPSGDPPDRPYQTISTEIDTLPLECAPAPGSTTGDYAEEAETYQFLWDYLIPAIADP